MFPVFCPYVQYVHCWIYFLLRIYRALYGHFEGKYPWAYFEHFTNEKMAKIVGAKKEEVIVMNGLTVNLHQSLVCVCMCVGVGGWGWGCYRVWGCLCIYVCIFHMNVCICVVFYVYMYVFQFLLGGFLSTYLNTL